MVMNIIHLVIVLGLSIGGLLMINVGASPLAALGVILYVWGNNLDRG